MDNKNQDLSSLESLGWQAFFQQQLGLQEWESSVPGRVTEQHRSQLEVATLVGQQLVPVKASMPPITVGDWLLLDASNQFQRLLERKSCFSRKAAGSKVSEQLMAANVDTAFIVCSLNDDFNLNRIERYLSLVNKTGAEAVVVLSKMDLCSDPHSLRKEVQRLDQLLCVETVNCLDRESVGKLLPWCGPGKTIVLLGSSGSGKSTLTNSLLGVRLQQTGEIREDDAKGRHTTTRRSLLQMPGGALMLDTPGMRELQLADCEEGVAATFSDIESLAEACRFADCRHGQEPGCAVRNAIESEQLDERRFQNYCKLMREQAMNSASLAERRSSDRQLGKFYKRVIAESKKIKRG